MVKNARKTNKSAGKFEPDVLIVRDKIAATLGTDPSALAVTGSVVSIPGGWFITVNPLAQRYEVQQVIAGMVEDAHAANTLAHLRRYIGNNKHHIGE